jgi:hypothetical protein
VVEPNGREAIEEFADERGVVCLCVFVTSPPSIRYERLVNRFITDIEQLELDSMAMKTQVRKFAERLAITSEVESKWVDEDWQYDIIIDSFGKGNTTAVVNQVSAAALNCLSVDHRYMSASERAALGH